MNPPIQYTPWAEGFSFASLARPGSIIMLVAFGLFAAGWICLFWNVCQQGPEGDDPEISDHEVRHLCLRLFPVTIHTAWDSHTRTATPYTPQKDSDSGSDSDSESGSGSDSESGSETGSDSGSEVRGGFVGRKKANTRNAMQCNAGLMQPLLTPTVHALVVTLQGGSAYDGGTAYTASVAGTAVTERTATTLQGGSASVAGSSVAPPTVPHTTTITLT